MTDRLCYMTYGTGAGYYHYAVNLLEGIHEVDPDVEIDVFYVGDGADSQFPAYVSEHRYVHSGPETMLWKLFATAMLQLALLRYLAVSRPTVIHINTHLRSQWYTLYVTVLSTLFRIPLVRTVHEQTTERLGEVSDLTRRMATLNYRLADQLIVHTEAQRRQFRTDGVRNPISVVPHGNYLFFRDYVDEAVPSPFGDHDRPVVLFFGVKEHKGIGVFLDAVGEVSADVDVWVVGPVNDGDARYARRAESATDVQTRLGFIADDELWRYFHHADIVALPYLQGTTSGALQTALAFETAVITSELPCFTEYVTDEEHARVLPAVEANELAAAIEELAREADLRAELSRKGLVRARSIEFDWTDIGRETLTIYDTVVGR